MNRIDSNRESECTSRQDVGSEALVVDGVGPITVHGETFRRVPNTVSERESRSLLSK